MQTSIIPPPSFLPTIYDAKRGCIIEQVRYMITSVRMYVCTYVRPLPEVRGRKLRALVRTSIKRPPPFFFAELRCKKGGRIIEQVWYMITSVRTYVCMYVCTSIAGSPGAWHRVPSDLDVTKRGRTVVHYHITRSEVEHQVHDHSNSRIQALAEAIAAVLLQNSAE